MYFTRVCVLQNKETQRESCILRGFERFEAMKQGVNHVFCGFLSASKQCNRAWIMYFAGFWALRGNETERESRILQAFERFEAMKQSVNHAFCKVLSVSKHWNTAWITYFARFWALWSIETRRESRIFRGFDHFESLQTCPESQFGQPSENGSWLIQSSYEKYHFLVQLGRGPGSPSGSQMSQEKSREAPLSDKKML